MRIVENINECLSKWWNNKESKKLFFTLIVLQLALAGITIAMLQYFIGDDFFSRIYLPENMHPDITQKYINVNLMLSPLMVIYSFITVYIYFLLIRIAMKQFGIKSGKFDTKKMLHSFVLMVATVFSAFFSWQQKKLLLAPALTIILTFIQIAIIPISLDLAKVIGISIWLLIIFYFIAVIRNGIRLMLSFPVFYSENLSIQETVQESWELTEGKALHIFIQFFVITAITFILGGALTFALFEIGKEIGIWIGVLFTATVISTLGQILISALSTMWYTYLTVIIYKNVKEK